MISLRPRLVLARYWLGEIALQESLPPGNRAIVGGFVDFERIQGCALRLRRGKRMPARGPARCRMYSRPRR